MYLCRKINPEVSYVTFCRGEGACKEGVMLVKKVLLESF
jgi:hypothetical protein